MQPRRSDPNAANTPATARTAAPVTIDPIVPHAVRSSARTEAVGITGPVDIGADAASQCKDYGLPCSVFAASTPSLNVDAIAALLSSPSKPIPA